MSLGTLTVNLLMKTGQFETDVKRAEKRLQKLKKEAADSVKAVGLSFAAGAAVGVGIFISQIKGAVDAADEMGKMAQKVGVTTEALSALTFAASQSEVEVGSLQKALAKLSVDLTQSNSDLRALGITAKTSDEALIQLADKFASMPDGLEKTAAAAKIFGERIGPDLIPLLNLGSKGINDLKERAQELGIVISEDMARDADRFNDTMDEVKGAMQGAFLKVSVDLIPIMQEFANYMASAEFRDRIGSGVTAMGKIAEAILRITAAVVETTSYAGERVGELTTGSGSGASVDYAKKRISEIKSLPKNSFNPFAQSQASEAAKLAEFERIVQEDNARKIAASVNLPPALRQSGKGLSTVLGGNSGGSSRSVAASQESAAADRAAAEAKDNLRRAAESLNQALDAQTAELGGPLVQAAQQYRDKLVDLQAIEDEYTKQGKLTLDVQQDLNLAREQALTLYEQEAGAIQSQLTPAQDQLKRMQEVLDLLKMTNDERVRAAFLIDNPDATASQAQQAVDTANALIQTTQTIQAMDELRNSAADAFESFLDGSKSAKDAFKDFADSVLQQITRIIAQQAATALFGDFGTTGSDTGGGGLFANLFGSLFGGGRASGGSVQGGMMYRVNENGPEILNYKGEDFLMMGGQGGFVKPNRGGGGAVINVNVSPTTDRRSAQQVAQRIAEKQRTATARNA